MPRYLITLESLPKVYAELEPLFREHYAEFSARLLATGVTVSPYNPRLDEYFRASDGGWLKTFVVRLDGQPCGYANIYVTTDMHNRELIAQEDTLYVSKAHRNGIGRKLSLFVLETLKGLGVKRFTVSAVTDTRATKLWKRIGFREIATQMVHTLGGC